MFLPDYTFNDLADGFLVPSFGEVTVPARRPRWSVASKKEDDDFEVSPLEAANLIHDALVDNHSCLWWRLPPLVFSLYVDCPQHRRKQIEDAYLQFHGKNLVTELRLQTKPCSFLRTAIVVVATPLAHYYAQKLHKALTRPFIKNYTDVLLMLCPIRRDDLIDANYAYWLRYGMSLEFEIKSNIFGFFQRLLVNLSLPRRSSDPFVEKEVKEDLLLLLESGGDKTTFIRVFTTRSFEHLHCLFVEFKKSTGISIETAIVRFFNRKLQYGMLYLTKVARGGRAAFLAGALFGAIKSGKKKKVLRLLKIHSEHKEDLLDVDEQLSRKHRTSLRRLIEEYLQGDFQKLCLALLGLENSEDSEYQ